MNKQQITSAHDQFLGELTRKCSLSITLQTNLKTYNISNWLMEKHIDTAHQVMRSFKPKLNRLLTGNGYRRNPELLPILIFSLEGTTNTYDHNRTLHFHIAAGNFDNNRLDVDFLETFVKHWTGTGIGTNDIKITSLTRGREHGWGTYINKETHKGNEWCVDYASTQIPSHLLAY
jgi:hypothetical protein